MSRYRRRVRDDLVDVVFDVIRSAAPEAPLDEAAVRAQAEREAARQAAKAEARRQREMRSLRSYAGAGVGLLVGGLTSLVAPTVAAVGAGLLAGGAAAMLLKAIQNGVALPDLGRWFPKPPPPKRAIDPPEVDGRNLPRSQRDLIQGVLDDASDQLRKLDEAARSLDGRDAAAAGLCRRLVSAGERLSDAIADEPNKFSVAQRLFTYNLPKAVYVAETLVSLADTPSKRADDARHVLARMEMVFEKTLLDLAEIDAAEMDLEMRLINQSLDEELRARPERPAP